MRLREGDLVHDIAVHPSPGNEGALEVVVDGRRQTVWLRRLAEGRFVLQAGSLRETFHCVTDGGTVHLFWRGGVHVLQQEREGGRPSPRGEGARPL